MAKHNICGICLEHFEAGDRLTALPCATDGCPSVWHSDCIREWLCQGHSTSCPLCRGKVEPPGAESGMGTPPTLALEVRAAVPLQGGGNAARRITQDVIPELLLLALLSMNEPSMQVSQIGGSSMFTAEALPGQPHSGLELGGSSLVVATRVGTGIVTPRSPSWLSLLSGPRRPGSDLPSPSSSSMRGRSGWRDPFSWLSGHRRSSSSEPRLERARNIFSTVGVGTRSNGAGDGEGALLPVMPWSSDSSSPSRSTMEHTGPISPLETFQDNLENSRLPPLPTDSAHGWRSRLVAEGRRSFSRMSGMVRRRAASNVR